jgi:hypothetical protein
MKNHKNNINNMKLKKYNQLFEADIKDTLPEDYIRDVRRRASPHMGGPTMRDFQESMRLMDSIFRIQDGKEEELTQIGIDILQEHYGRMLEDIELDVKIVKPDDPEKLDMTDRMQNKDQDEDQDEDQSEDQDEEKDEPTYPTYEVPINVPKDEVDRRKIVNNVMQGEAQNVHSMLFTAKEKIDAINPRLLDLYIKHLELNRRFDWDENKPADLEEQMKQRPEMANACETEYPKEEDGKIKIIARVLDLPMIIHETVKAIYELMAAKAIPSDQTMAEALLKQTDTLKDEEEDIKYGPYIAADLRDYINSLLQRTERENVQVIPNLREFIFSKMMDLPANVFVELIKNILTKEFGEADETMKDYNLVQDAIKDVKGEVEQKPTYTEDDSNDERGMGEEDDDVMDLINKPKKEEPKEEPKKKEWFEYSRGELNNFLNDAIDEQDWTKAREIQKAIERKENNIK